MLPNMFHRPPSPYHRTRHTFHKICFAVLVGLVVVSWQSYAILARRQAAHTAVDDLQSAVRSAETILDGPLDVYSRSVYDVGAPLISPQHHAHMVGETVGISADQAPSLKLSPFSRSKQQRNEDIEVTGSIVKGDVVDAFSMSHSHVKDTQPAVQELSKTAKKTRAILSNQGHRNDTPLTALNVSRTSDDPKSAWQAIQTPATNHDLTDDLRPPIESMQDMTPWSASYRFPACTECDSLKEKADALPDMVVVPFADAVHDIPLDGWEDEWVSKARYTGPKLDEPKIDFVYNWINGSQPELTATMHPYEVNSTLNDDEGVWLASHGSNRYREWDELRYSMRSVEKYAGSFANRIQILVNAFEERSHDGSQIVNMGKQRPHWLKDVEQVQVLSQEEFFGPEERKCLPSFDSLTIENQLYNTKSETDRLFALSDDMILGKPHAASDLYSPLFGPTLGFKDNAYNTLQPPTEKDAERFGEKPFLIYTSWLLNRRFGARKRKGQVHFGHSLSRSITREAITSFPRPALRSALQRFRGETGFQLYSWYVIFHYTMERHREALLWSYIMLRSDTNDDGYLSWSERKNILQDLTEGMGNKSPELFRHRAFYQVGSHLEDAGLEPPKVNTDILWTSLDGPLTIKDLDCDAFDTEDCLAPGFSLASSDARSRSPVFSSAAIFDRAARESPRCGDCLLKLVLNRRPSGLGPLLPHPAKKAQQRETVVKAIMKYQYSVVQPDASFYMVTDAEQAEHTLLRPYVKRQKKVGQMCLNDDVVTQDEGELEALRKVMSKLFEGLLPEKSSYEL